MESRKIRTIQDEAYAESLKIDNAKVNNVNDLMALIYVNKYVCCSE